MSLPPSRAVSSQEPRTISASVETSRANFYSRKGKRIFDLVVGSVSLLMVSPLLVLIAIGVKLSSPGPILFCQERVGKQGKLFRIFKFRSMRQDAERLGPQVTSQGDSRVTWFGALIRKMKLDELPQLWNVLRGDMSLVGPRPEVAKYVAMYTAKQRAVLDIAPGITDTASICYVREEEILGRESNPETFYVERVMQQKLAMNAQYLDHISFSGDLLILWRTAIAALRHDPGRRDSNLWRYE